MSFDSTQSVESIQSNLSVMSLEDDYEDISEEVEIFKESEDRSETYTEFPNDVYKNLMILVTKHKLNNKAGNDIIRFLTKIQTLQNPRYQKILKRDENSWII